MKEIPTTMKVVDTTTGEVVETQATSFKLMPVMNPKACQECGREHHPQQPHDALSMYYQYSFFADHERWPTWKDAMAHCDPDIAEAWEKALRDMGRWDEPQ